MPSSLYSGTPGGIMNYISQQKGIQLSTRFRVSITRPNSSNVDFMCDMAQIPSRKLRAYNDFMSGAAAPIGIPYGMDHNSNVFQFITEETWISRKYFEDWQSAFFKDTSGNSNEDFNRVEFLENVAGDIQIRALSTAGSGGDPITTAIVVLSDSFPLEIVPVKLDASAFNTPVRFMVNVFYARSTWYPV
jgi:hypothetical protein